MPTGINQTHLDTGSATSVLVITTGSDFKILSEADFSVYARHYSHCRLESVGSGTRLLEVTSEGFDIIHLLCRISDSGSIVGLALSLSGLLDAKYGAEVPAAIRSMKIQCVRTSRESPWQNGVAERWVESCRRDLLDHVIALNESHLKRLLTDYVRYYHEDRLRVMSFPIGDSVVCTTAMTARRSSHQRSVAKSRDSSIILNIGITSCGLFPEQTILPPGARPVFHFHAVATGNCAISGTDRVLANHSTSPLVGSRFDLMTLPIADHLAWNLINFRIAGDFAS